MNEAFNPDELVVTEANPAPAGITASNVTFKRDPNINFY